MGIDVKNNYPVPLEQIFNKMNRNICSKMVLFILGLNFLLFLLGLLTREMAINDIRKFTNVTLKYGLLLFIVFYETNTFRSLTKKINLFFIPILFIGLILVLMKYQFGTYIFLASYLTIMINFFIATFSKQYEKIFLTLISILLFSNFFFFLLTILNFPGRPIFLFFDLVIMVIVFIHLLNRVLSKRQIT